MELIYIWVKDFKIIKEQGFNFNSNWKNQYNQENNSLSIDKKAPLPTDFFGSNVINVSAVVGENGAGKSTLFEFLLGHYFTPYEFLYHDTIAVWNFVNNDGEPSLVIHRSNQLSEGEFIVPEVGGFKIFDESFSPDEELEKREFHKRKQNPINTFDKILYSNSIDQRYFYFKGFNISSLYLMRGGELDISQADDLLIENTNHNHFQVHFFKDLKRQLGFLSQDPDLPFSPLLHYIFFRHN